MKKKKSKELFTYDNAIFLLILIAVFVVLKALVVPEDIQISKGDLSQAWIPESLCIIFVELVSTEIRRSS